MEWLTSAGGALGVAILIAVAAVLVLLAMMLVHFRLKAGRLRRIHHQQTKKDDEIESQLREAGFTAGEARSALQDSHSDRLSK